MASFLPSPPNCFPLPSPSLFRATVTESEFPQLLHFLDSPSSGDFYSIPWIFPFVPPSCRAVEGLAGFPLASFTRIRPFLFLRDPFSSRCPIVIPRFPRDCGFATCSKFFALPRSSFLEDTDGQRKSSLFSGLLPFPFSLFLLFDSSFLENPFNRCNGRWRVPGRMSLH